MRVIEETRTETQAAPARSGTVDTVALAREIRKHGLAMIYHAGSGHPGGALSAADMLACLWGRELSRDPEDPERDRFVLSKGHACPALYAAVAEVGLLPRYELGSFRKLGGVLQGHPHVLDTPWAETSTGSLGQGFSVAIGLALGLRHRDRGGRVYVMLGDGELQEGEVWEGAMCAAHHGLDNLCALIDYNKMQSDDTNANVMGLEPLADKWRAFGWHVREIDGHDHAAIEDALAEARGVRSRPVVVLAHTVKGRGVSFMEGSPLWHGSVRLRDEELVRALEDLGLGQDEAKEYLDGSIWTR